MKSLLFLSIAFLAGADGFAIFAPYLGLLLAFAYYIRCRQRRRRALVAVTAKGTTRAIDVEEAMLQST